MNREIIMRSGATVTAVINGEYHNYVCDTEELAIEMIKEALVIKASGDADELLKFFLPSFRVTEAEGIERSRTGVFFLSGTDIEIPELLVIRIKEHLESGLPIEPLINFWKLTLTNENKDVIKDLFAFADRFNFPITSKGYFIAYKSVAWIGERHKDYALKASQKYIEMVAAGKNPEDIVVVEYGKDKDNPTVHFIDAVDYQTEIDELGEYYYSKYYDLEEWLVDNNWEKWSLWTNVHPDATSEEIQAFAITVGWVKPDVTSWGLDAINFVEHGTVLSVFQDLPTLFATKEPMFTDWHTRKMDIRLGQPVKMNMSDCDTDRENTCSSGLHVGAPGYVKGFYGGDDRYVIACLVNPADVAAVPVDYSFEKMRTSQYYPYAVCEISAEGYLKEIETKFFEEDYVAYELNDINSKLEALKVSPENASEAETISTEQLETMLQARLILLEGTN